MENYEILSNEKLQCPYCSKVITLWNVNRHMKSKICQKFKEKYFKVYPDKTPDEFDLEVNKLKQNVLNKLNEED
jgi:hypothetical protein